jgi:hypothetical protein
MVMLLWLGRQQDDADLSGQQKATTSNGFGKVLRPMLKVTYAES